jgi:chromate transporter
VLGELAWLFFRLGSTAFGGPAAHIAMTEDEVVGRRKWLTREELLDLIAACNLIPGPNSTELAIHIGHRRAGWKGLLVAGTCFILPAALIVAAIAWAYVRWGALPEVGAVLYGIKPVIIAIVVAALWRLGKTAIKTWALGAIAALAVGATLLGVNELLVLVGAGALAAARIAGSRTAVVVPLAKLFGVFAKIGSIGCTG